MRTKSSVTQMEVKRVANALRAAGIPTWRIEVDRPDGSKFSIVACTDVDEETAEDEIDRMIRRVP